MATLTIRECVGLLKRVDSTTPRGTNPEDTRRVSQRDIARMERVLARLADGRQTGWVLDACATLEAALQNIHGARGKAVMNADGMGWLEMTIETLEKHTD